MQSLSKGNPLDVLSAHALSHVRPSNWGWVANTAGALFVQLTEHCGKGGVDGEGEGGGGVEGGGGEGDGGGGEGGGGEGGGGEGGGGDGDGGGGEGGVGG